MKDVRLLVSGSRTIESPAVVSNLLDEALQEWQIDPSEIECLISGGARGVDRLAELWAGPRGLTIRQFLPDWEGLGRSAGMTRNLQMLDFVAEAPRPRVAVLWDRQSRGTKHTLDEARRRGLDVKLFLPKTTTLPTLPLPKLPKLRVRRGL